MTTLNRTASEIVTAATGVHAMTDVTGFGLMGHGRELALGSGVTIEIEVEAFHASRVHSMPSTSAPSRRTAGESRLCRVRQRRCTRFSNSR